MLKKSTPLFTEKDFGTSTITFPNHPETVRVKNLKMKLIKDPSVDQITNKFLDKIEAKEKPVWSKITKLEHKSKKHHELD